jgi:acetolactate synthase-1/2/3 large subunit
VKVAHKVAEFLRDNGIKHVFTISGGADLHIIHGIAETEGIDFVCPQNEQAAGFAADAYARLHGIGCALATSGPGGTNLLTPIAASYYDSVPVLYLTGQVATFRMDLKGCRQSGFQQTPIVDMVKPITKYAVTVTNKDWVIPELTMALRYARSGRMGPVLVDLCDDVQRMDA